MSDDIEVAKTTASIFNCHPQAVCFLSLLDKDINLRSDALNFVTKWKQDISFKELSPINDNTHVMVYLNNIFTNISANVPIITHVGFAIDVFCGKLHHQEMWGSIWDYLKVLNFTIVNVYKNNKITIPGMNTYHLSFLELTGYYDIKTHEMMEQIGLPSRNIPNCL